MISIITAIYNQLSMNKLYYESLKHATDGEWELIIVDNGSTDGSAEWFEQCGGNVRVIRNGKNYSYPYCQNVGIKNAKGDVLAFLNNDILLSPHWDSRVMEVLGKEGYEILSLCSNMRMPEKKEAKRACRRWKWIKNPLLFVFDASEWSLRLMTRLYYGNDFDSYCEQHWLRYGKNIKPGFPASGSAVIMSRRGLKMIGGGWDPTQQNADYDLYLQTKQLHNSGANIQPLSMVCGIYHHHYSRLTFNQTYPPYADAANLKECEDKWGEEMMRQTIQELKR